MDAADKRTYANALGTFVAIVATISVLQAVTALSASVVEIALAGVLGTIVSAGVTAVRQQR